MRKEFIVTDSMAEYQQIVAELDPSRVATQLYSDNLRTFEINTSADQLMTGLHPPGSRPRLCRRWRLDETTCVRSQREGYGLRVSCMRSVTMMPRRPIANTHEPSRRHMYGKGRSRR
jgi:hypothetical protein